MFVVGKPLGPYGWGYPALLAGLAGSLALWSKSVTFVTVVTVTGTATVVPL